jgi:hypothetical protein
VWLYCCILAWFVELWSVLNLAIWFWATSSATWLSCRLPCGCHVVCHVAATSFATWLPRRLPRGCHVVCQRIAHVIYEWCGKLIHDDHFRTPIYDGLRTSWITLIHDKNLRTSREGIRDAQYMTFSNFVIDVILWRNFDDPWRKLTVIDHEIFCSESYCLLYQHSFHFPSFVQIIDIFLWIAVLVMKENEKSKLSYSYYIPLGTML